jgi:hypothetical protein
MYILVISAECAKQICAASPPCYSKLSIGSTCQPLCQPFQVSPKSPSCLYPKQSSFLRYGSQALLPCQLDQLTSLICNYNIEEVEDHSFPKSLYTAAFTNLHTLTLIVKLKNLYHFFADTYNLFPLTKLHIHLSQIVDPHPALSSRASDIAPFLALVASRCPILEDVNFNFFSYSSAYTDRPPAAHVIGFSAIQPLLSCPCITSFGISHEYSLSLQLGQVEQIICGWPYLTQLSLNLHPTQLNPSLLDLKVLHLLANLCPNLRQLGVYIDCRQ